ncbi:MAG: A24 family peptidase [Endozoicomonas sp.]
MSLVYGVLLLLVIATVFDLFQHRIPNMLLLSGLAVALVLQYQTAQLAGLGQAMVGLLAGFLCFLPAYLFRKVMGAGDVKLLAVVGAFIGPAAVAFSAVYTVIAGGVLALIYLTLRGGAWRTIQRYYAVARSMVWLPAAEDDVVRQRFPYALAIAVGTCIQLARQGDLTGLVG